MKKGFSPLFLTLILVYCLLLIPSTSFSQSETKEEINLKFGGYINWTANYDSRQTVSLREGYLFLYPADKKLDEKGNDINDKPNLNFLAIQTRLNTRIDGPQALGAKASGFIEAEFFGTSDGDMNGFRLRHAFLSLKWENTTLLVGQTWHPMVIAEAYPLVVSFNTGSPFQPLSRNPQIRLTHSFGKFSLMTALVSQRDFTSGGPNGFSSVYMRNAGVPAAHLQAIYKDEHILLGIGGDVKKISPQIETSKKISTDENIVSYDGLSYAKYYNGNFAIAVQGIYGQNMADMLMLGGYGVSGIDTVTGKQTYSNMDVYSLWSDITYGKELQAGLFIGYSKSLGSDKELVGSSFTRVNNIDNIMRFSPRLQYTVGKIRLATEVEYTKAFYGKPDECGKVKSCHNVSNTRVLLSTYYNF